MTSKFSRVSGFNPRFIIWWIKGCRIPTTVTFPTRRLATRTRQNLYALRTAMLNENHHAASMVERGEIIHRPVHSDHADIDDPHTLTIRPANFDLNDILDEAGIEAPTLEDDGGGSPPITPTTYPECPRPFDYANAMGEGDDGEGDGDDDE